MLHVLSPFAAFVLLLCWLAAVPIFLFMGLRGLFTSRSKDSDSDSRLLHLGFLDLAFALALGMAPFVAAKLAEITTGWTDPDGDGMLANFVMGRYDWADYVLPSAVLWAVGIVVTLVVLRSLLRRRWT